MLTRLREEELVDYAGVAKAKLEVLELLFKETRRRPAPMPFSIYEALREKFGYGWEGWPEEYRDPSSAAVRSFARKNAHRVAFYEYIQHAARMQLDAVQARALELGMRRCSTAGATRRSMRMAATRRT